VAHAQRAIPRAIARIDQQPHHWFTGELRRRQLPATTVAPHDKQSLAGAREKNAYASRGSSAGHCLRDQHLVTGAQGLVQPRSLPHHLLVDESSHVFAHRALVVKYIMRQRTRGLQSYLQSATQITGLHHLRRAFVMATQAGSKFDSHCHGSSFPDPSRESDRRQPPYAAAHG